jgi:hypothetical protein
MSEEQDIPKKSSEDRNENLPAGKKNVEKRMTIHPRKNFPQK